MGENNENVNEASAPTETAAPPPQATYTIHNTVRGRHNRVLRMQQPKHHALKQYIAGTHRLMRGRPLTFTEDQLFMHMKEIQEKEAAGILEVRNAYGQRIDLRTGDPMNPLVPAPPRPTKRPDSIAHDKKTGIPMPQYRGGIPETANDPNLVPELVKEAGGEEPPTDTTTAPSQDTPPDQTQGDTVPPADQPPPGDTEVLETTEETNGPETRPQGHKKKKVKP